jgi:hypothetical protein
MTGHQRRKGRMLGEFTKVVSCHRKTVIRLLRRGCVNSGGRGDMGSVGGACLFACTAGLC